MPTDPSPETDRDSTEVVELRVMSLMRLLGNLNAGATLALCLWLAWAAMDHTTRDSQAGSSIPVRGCNCSLTQITDRPGRIDVASGHQISD